MKHKKREPRCIKGESSLVWVGRKICQRCLNIAPAYKIEKNKKGANLKKDESSVIETARILKKNQPAMGKFPDIDRDGLD